MRTETDRAAAAVESLETLTVGVVGARGYVGVELLEIICSHPLLRLEYAVSRAADGDPIADHAKASAGGLKFEALSDDEIADRAVDVVVLALPDGAAKPYVEKLESAPKPPRLIVDVSADHRFDDSWVYGLAEHNRHAIAGAPRISNPGCYATAAQLAVRPILDMLADTPHCFGVSGYSGAGKKRSSRNDHKALANGVLPYKLVNHTHEREITRHLGTPVRFSPHVAPFFRGITLTVQARAKSATSVEAIAERLENAYRDCPLIMLSGADTPRVQDVVSKDGAVVGGIAVNPDRPDEIALVCALDNLRKGAASQAVQNINLAFGLTELTGLPDAISMAEATP
ncbi:MAG: N-acetyl-gamma-glutamyl-phosphate reductase [Phycisphaerae bacterium]|nr:N-acetyl-gamma-glutamyl-phosphate reductase [Phycisphaerae bacterium]